MAEEAGNRRNKRRRMRSREKRRLAAVLVLDLALLLAIAVVGGLLFWRSYKEAHRPDLSAIEPAPWHDSMFLAKNPYSRPGIKRERVESIVVHYVANPGTSAAQNRNYFQSLSKQSPENAVSASSHYIIGLEGEIVQCIPLDEVAYANYPRNEDTVSIECCHPDETGVFTEETKKSLIRLTAWLCQELRLNEKDIIRHYDVSGKKCPLYYVDHEEAWGQLRSEIKDALRDGKKGKES